jgi:predicted DNA-binding protein
MSSPVTLRLDRQTKERIARVARRKQISNSQAIRQAIETWIEDQEPAASPYEIISDLIGVVHGGNRTRSVGGGRKFAAALKRRRDSR